MPPAAPTEPPAPDMAQAPAPEATPEPAPAEEGGGAAIPDEVLQIPEFAALLSGAPPALTVPKDASGPEVDAVVKNGKALTEAGIGFLKASAGDTVVYNTQFIEPDQIMLADKKGKLLELAPPWEEVKASMGAALSEGGKPAAPAGKVEATVTGAPGPMPKPAPASAMKSVANARIKNVSPSGPTKGAVPGGGRVMNAIMQPVI